MIKKVRSNPRKFNIGQHTSMARAVGKTIGNEVNETVIRERWRQQEALARFQAEERRKSLDKKTTKEYKSRLVPKVIAENPHNVQQDYYEQYQQKYMAKKKVLEIQVLRENKNQEVLNKITGESDADRSRQQVRDKALKAINDAKKLAHVEKQLALMAEKKKIKEQNRLSKGLKSNRRLN